LSRKSPSKSDHARIAELFSKGFNDKAIALKLGYSGADVVRATRAKLGLRKTRNSPINRAEVERLHLAGKTSGEIAESMGYSVNYIRKIKWLMYL
jgi:hypothetical protein